MSLSGDKYYFLVRGLKRGEIEYLCQVVEPEREKDFPEQEDSPYLEAEQWMLGGK